MNEAALRRVSAKLGIRITGRQKQWLHAACPLARWRHKSGVDRNPSFGLLINEQGESYYKCFSCNSKGRVSSLIRTINNYRAADHDLSPEDQEAYKQLAREADRLDYDFTPPTYEEMLAQASTPQLQFPEPLDERIFSDLYDDVTEYPEAVAYLKSRRISKAAAQLLDLRYDEEEQRILFPVRDYYGELYGFTGRTILPPHLFIGNMYKGRKYPKVKDYNGLPKQFMLLGAELVEDDKPIFVVEGLFGYAHLVSIGARRLINPVAMLGAELTDAKARELISWGHTVYLLPDNDEAGRSCLWGHKNPKTQKYSGNGAVKKLKGHVSVAAPLWIPNKADPDELTLEDVQILLETNRFF